MTEDEAKTKWCPFFQLAGKMAMSTNRGYSGGFADTYCIGSECMAWRWEDKSYQDGYCGLAGTDETVR